MCFSAGIWAATSLKKLPHGSFRFLAETVNNRRISLFIISHYYTAMFQKDWKQTNSRIWLAKIDLEHGLDFPI